MAYGFLIKASMALLKLEKKFETNLRKSSLVMFSFFYFSNLKPKSGQEEIMKLISIEPFCS